MSRHPYPSAANHAFLMASLLVAVDFYLYASIPGARGDTERVLGLLLRTLAIAEAGIAAMAFALWRGTWRRKMPEWIFTVIYISIFLIVFFGLPPLIANAA